MKVHLNKAFVSRIKCEESKSKQEFNDIQMIGFFLEVRKNGKKRDGRRNIKLYLASSL